MIAATTARPRLLFLVSRFPHPPVGGDKLRAFNLIKSLGEHFDVDVFSLYSSSEEIATIDALRDCCRAVHVHHVSRPARALNTIGGWLRGLPMQVAYYSDSSGLRRARDLIAGGGYDVVLPHLVRMLEYAGAFPPERVVLELTDAISMNYARIRRPSTPREFLYVLERSRLLRYELEALKKVSRGVLVSGEDAAYLARHRADPASMTVIRNGTVLAGSRLSVDYVADRIIFLGNMRTTQNEDMCLWFIRVVFPLVRAARPSAEFLVAGVNPSRRLLAFHGRDGVRVLGPVADPAETLSSAAVSVCPMRYGAGLQNKILESMAVGVPVVATSRAAVGIGARDGVEILVANDPAGLAAKVLSVLEDRDLRARLGAAAGAFIGEHFHWPAQMGAYVSLVHAAAATAPALKAASRARARKKAR